MGVGHVLAMLHNEDGFNIEVTGRCDICNTQLIRLNGVDCDCPECAQRSERRLLEKRIAADYKRVTERDEKAKRARVAKMEWERIERARAEVRGG